MKTEQEKQILELKLKIKELQGYIKSLERELQNKKILEKD
jgi:hypothetical protein